MSVTGRLTLSGWISGRPMRLKISSQEVAGRFMFIKMIVNVGSTVCKARRHLDAGVLASACSRQARRDD